MAGIRQRCWAGSALSPNQRIDVTTTAADWLGSDWGISSERLNIKRYPTVGASQRGADCAVLVHRDVDPVTTEMTGIRTHISENHARVMPIHAPKTALEAKFSLEFAISAGLIVGEVGFAQLNDTFVNRADVQTLLRKVRLVIGPDDDPEFSAGARADIIHLDMADGRVISSPEVTRWRGHARNPMTTSELKAKFMDCAASRIGAGAASAPFETLGDQRALSSVADIPLIAPA